LARTVCRSLLFPATRATNGQSARNALAWTVGVILTLLVLACSVDPRTVGFIRKPYSKEELRNVLNRWYGVREPPASSIMVVTV
jgi:hypothetical protein